MKETSTKLDSSCMLTEIFDRQKELMEKYHPIEEASGLVQSTQCPVDIHDRYGQARLRDFAWRITEELGEASLSLESSGQVDDHFKEELIDALHFVVEMLIVSGIETKDIRTACGNYALKDLLLSSYRYALRSPYLTDNQVNGQGLRSVTNSQTYLIVREVSIKSYQVIHRLAEAVNCLKNKAWKQTHVVTNSSKYFSCLLETFFSLIRLYAFVGLSPKEVHSVYVLKQKLNNKRIETGY